MNVKTLPLIISLCVLITIFSGCTSNHKENGNVISVDQHGGADFSTIQSAIDAAKEKDTISVAEGIYVENILINKSITLAGSSPENTIIDGNQTGDVIHIERDAKVTITGFTIRNSGSEYAYPDYDAGIDILSSYSTIKNNIITKNSNGIFSKYSTYNNYTNNLIHSNSDYGIYLYSVSNDNNLTYNTFSNNSYGLRIKGSNRNTVTKNIFKDNQRGLYFCCGATNNLVYHNNFVNNNMWHGNDHVGGNSWNNGYPISGNYWDDYNGNDTYSGPDQNITGSDGIGDTIYEVTRDKTKIDRYPLMKPITID